MPGRRAVALITGASAVNGFYDLRISRGGSGARIEGEEWLALIRSDDSLLLRDVLEGRNPRAGEVMLINRPLTAQWLNHPDQVAAFFMFEEGEIVGRWLDEPSVEKAGEIAAALRAGVVRTID